MGEVIPLAKIFYRDTTTREKNSNGTNLLMITGDEDRKREGISIVGEWGTNYQREQAYNNFAARILNSFAARGTRATSSPRDWQTKENRLINLAEDHMSLFRNSVSSTRHGELRFFIIATY
jgi:hypothetical protein